MALRYKWDEEIFIKAIETAKSAGESLHQFDSLADAESFRFAFYHLRKRKGVGRGYSLMLDEDNFEILIKKTPRFTIKRVLEEESIG